jgi:P-type Ca2+ transporter type 2C
MSEKLRGLSENEAKIALSQHGANELDDLPKTTIWNILFRQIKKNYIIYLLIATAIISLLVGKNITAYTILTVVLFVIVSGFIQEYRADKAISSLKKMLMPISIVIREGKRKEVPSSELVPEDIVAITSGDKVPADAVIISSVELRLDESALTGESVEVTKMASKSTDTVDENHVFMGTYVVNGKAYAKVVATGMNTRFGKIAGMISATEKSLPLQDKVNQISKYMVVVAVVMSISTGLIMFSQAPVFDTNTLVNILILVIAIAVSAFPEGFPVVLVTTLSTGAARMAKNNTIVNRMSIIETLGETTVVCTDKTGTITKGEMTVREIYTNDANINVSGSGYSGKGNFHIGDKKIYPKSLAGLYKLIYTAMVCNDAKIERTGEIMQYRVSGTPTEGALLILGVKADIQTSDNSYTRIEEKPFSSERKMMSVLVKEESNEAFVYAKGAPEVIIKKCTHYYNEGRIIKLDHNSKSKFIKTNQQMTKNALRTLAVAFKPTRTGTKHFEEENLVLIGLVGMEDPPRPEVKEAMEACRSAGIKVKMITGDNKETARAIAMEVGLAGNMLVGKQLDMMSDNELSTKLDDTAIFARVRPEHKLKIVNLLKKKGEIVTMTGDGVNDAPALKGAHIGVAMGINGTDVSRSVADITIRDDNFATIVLAIKEGRTIFNNIRKFVSYQLSCNLAELAVLFFGVVLAPVLGWEVPTLFALQILFMNLVTDNLPAITLGLNRSSKDIMNDPPRKGASILTKPHFYLMIFNGLLMGTITLIVYFISFNLFGESAAYARTTALVSLILLEIVSAFNFRSFRYYVLNRSPFVNSYLVAASLVSIVATLVIVYTSLNKTFETVPLYGTNWLIAISSAILFVLLFDLIKLYSNRSGKLFAHLL